MKKYGCLLLAVFLFHGYVYAQTGKKAFYLHSILGVNSPGLSDLDAALNRNGHLSLPAVYLSRGGGFYAFFNNTRLVSLFTFSSYSGARENGDQRNWARCTLIGTALGLDLKRKGRLQAIPYLGAGYAHFGLRVSNTAGSSSLFNGYLGGPSNQHHIATNQWLANLGLHLGASPVGYKGFAHKLDIALRAGYLLPLSQGHWKTSEQQLSNGPDINAGGFYASVILGIRQ